MLRELARAAEDASWDDAIRVVVVTGAGRAFCVGADLKAWSRDYLGKPGEYWKWFGAFKDAHDRLREIGKPTLARINGVCVGGGNELQMACDLSVIADDTYIRHVGPAARVRARRRARRSGCRSWSASAAPARSSSSARRSRRGKAEEWGLVNRAVPAAELDADRGRARREAGGQASADGPLHEAAAQLLARPRLARDGQPRARLAALSRWRPTSRRRRSRSSWRSSERRPRRARGADRGRPPQPARGAERPQRRADDRARGGARGPRRRRARSAASCSAAPTAPSRPVPTSARWPRRAPWTCTRRAASTAGTRSARCARRSSPRSPATASAAATSWRWRAI